MKKRLVRLPITLLLLLVVLGSLVPGPVVAQSRVPSWKTTQTDPDDETIHFENLDRVSPDGQWLAYVTARNLGMSDTKIWVSQSSGGEARVVASGDVGAWVSSPVWSPDSKYLAYIRVRQSVDSAYSISSQPELWIVDVTQDTSEGYQVDVSAVFNPALGHGGQTEIRWEEQDRLIFVDQISNQPVRYAVNPLTDELTALGYARSLDFNEIQAQPSNVPFFWQGDSRWGSNKLGNCSGLTIASHGCAMTSVSMIFKYFGVNVDPGSLNTWLKNHCGYLYQDSQGVWRCGGCLIVWATAANYSSKVSGGTKLGKNWNRLRSELDKGNPVVVGVNNGKHYVVVTGYSGNTYYINDPGRSDGKGRTLADFGNTFVSMIIYNGTASPDQKPHIAFTQANAAPITSRGQAVQSNNPNWTFSGTASDDKGVNYVNYSAWGNNGNVTKRASGTTSWNYTRNGLSGHNRIHFLAYDTSNQRNPDSDKYFIDLYIDTAAPTTNHNLSGASGDNGWYGSAVQVTLNAQDNGSGKSGSTHGIANRYTAGVNRLYYRVDGGSWQSTSSGHKTVTVSGSGQHTVEYYAVDKAGTGNQEDVKSVTFSIDTTPPTVPGAVIETHGVLSGQWQKDWNDPAFTWADATDDDSGIWYYRVDWGGTLQLNTVPSFDPLAVRTGSYELSVQAVDRAGNVGPAGAFFSFKYDGTRPHPPDIQNNDGVASGVWQNQVRTPDFSWPTPHDEGSGTQGVYRYWGPDENGTSATLITSEAFSSTSPICAEDDAATYYLRLQSEDDVGLQSDWVGYALRYDGAPPNVTLTANYGQPVVHNTNVHLSISASDLGSGVTQMHLSNNGYAWTEWQDIEVELYWEIPAVGRRSNDIYLQVHDAAGNLSQVVSDTVFFDVNVPFPQSENFHLWDSIVPGGADIVTSTSHVMRVTLGQPADSPNLVSTEYKLFSGFQAGALAEPETVPTSTSYIQLGSLMASATTSATAVSSSNYLLYGSLGQSSHMQKVTSTNYVANLGFWGGVAHDLVPYSPPLQEPQIPPECEFYSISVNDGALFTSSPLVSLGLCGPDPDSMMLSNDGGFGGATWQSYQRAISWTLTTYGNHILPRYVYARYRDNQGDIHGTFFDDIIYDPTAPSGQVAFDPVDLLPTMGLRVGGNPLRVVQERDTELFLSVTDDSSGMAEVQVSQTPDFGGAVWQPYSAIVPVTLTQEGLQTIYVRTRDHAGNISSAIGDSVIVDTTPPQGTARVIEQVVGPSTISVTLVLSATDVNGVGHARVSYSPAFTDALWVTYTTQLSIPVQYTYEITPLGQTLVPTPTLYTQLRDAAGNESAAFTTTYQVDVTPPTGYGEVIALDGMTTTLSLSAEDDLSDVTKVWLSSDFWFLENVTTTTYQETLIWNFEDNDELYIMFEDAVGNVSLPYWVPIEMYPDNQYIYLPLVLRNE
ncbi:MAG: hypothetical protein GY832_05230 [Chloroflexi bacterium]|nr:hypothetical protein [Chloroflexota bacterium]